MSLWRKIRGTQETIFQIALGGPQLKNNGGVIEGRNSADTGFAVVRGASPVGDNDLTTKTYVDTIASPTIVTAQISGASAIPNNTAVEHFIVVSTTGGNASIGDLIWDDGSNSGVATKLVAAARMIVTTVALSGGTVSFNADTSYVWDVAGTAWVSATPAGVSGALRAIRYTLGTAATQDSVAKIPANAIVMMARVNITTPYSGGATISIGQAGSLALLQATTDNLATIAGIYDVDLDTAWGVAALVVRATVAGTPGAGAASVTVTYCNPDA